MISITAKVREASERKQHLSRVLRCKQVFTEGSEQREQPRGADQNGCLGGSHMVSSDEAIKCKSSKRGFGLRLER